jgi:hypothetical protein
MTLTLQIPDEEQRLLAQKAADAGLDVQSYVERIVRVAAARPPIDEVLRPIREAFRASGMSDEELSDLLEKAKDEMRIERRRRPR